MSNYGAAAMEAAYQQIKAERAPHWRASEHAAFEQGWKACQAHAEALYAAEARDTPAEEHVHDWKRRQNIMTSGYAMPPYWACECGAAREVFPDDRA